MSPDAAGQFVVSAVSVTREDIARAKSWILQSTNDNVREMADEWVRAQNIAEIRKVDTDADDCRDVLTTVARSFSIRLAFFQAVWELIAVGMAVPSASPGRWEPPLESKTQRGGCAIPVRGIGCPHPERIERLPFTSDEPADTDIFLNGIDCKSLHPGILEAIEQSLSCFRRGLYMPTIAMLAAGAEATWTECGGAVATNLPDPRLAGVLSDTQIGISKIVTEVRRALEPKNAKLLLQKAGCSIHQVNDAEIWTTALWERRNALHWGKAKSFIAKHSEAGTLLLATPQHIKTLESIRIAS